MCLHSALTGLASTRGGPGRESPTTEMAKGGGPGVPLATSPWPAHHTLSGAVLDGFYLILCHIHCAG